MSFSETDKNKIGHTSFKGESLSVNDYEERILVSDFVNMEKPLDISKDVDKNKNDSYNPEKEDTTMSSFCVLYLGKEVYMASDSNSTLINGETDYNYQKIFTFQNGVFGVVGCNSINTKNGLRNIGDVLKDIIKNDIVSKKDFDQAIEFFIKDFKLTDSTTEIILLLYEGNNLVYKYYAFNSAEFATKEYIQIKPNTFHTYARNNATFAGGNSNFMTYANKNPKEMLAKYIKFNESVELFMHNTRLVGGPVQMYKVDPTGVTNLSEFPFN